MNIPVWKRWMLLAWLLSLWWGWLSLDAVSCPRVLSVSTADAVPQKQCWHLLIACFCQVFVSQLIYLRLLPASLRCWNDFFLNRLETFSRLWIWTGYFRPPCPDVLLTQSVFLFTKPLLSLVEPSRLGVFPKWALAPHCWDCPGQAL